MRKNSTEQSAVAVEVVCGKVVIEEIGVRKRALSAKRAIELASDLIDGAAKAAGQKAGTKTRGQSETAG